MAANSLSIIIPCFNEEGNIAGTVHDLVRELDGIVEDYEMIVFNDCSTDQTMKVIESLATENPRIRPIDNRTNMGLGYNYRKGVELATKEYVIMVPGDNEITAESVRRISLEMGKADIVVAYIENYHVRPIQRQVLSRLFTLTMNALFGFKLHYYNGLVLHRKALLQTVDMTTDGFAYQAEILIQMLKKGYSFTQVPMTLQPRSYGSSRAFSRKNILSVAKTVGRLVAGSKP